MRTFIVGDVHGCYYTLQYLLQKINFEFGKDKLFCTGDLIDRGKYSILSAFFFNNHNSVRGNHDDKYLRWLKGNNVNLSEKDGNYGQHYETLSENERQTFLFYFNSLPLVLHPTENTTIVHAGFYPWQNHLTFPETFDKKKRTCMYIRHIHSEVSYYEDTDTQKNDKNMFFDESLPMWHDLYKNKEYGGTVFFGHQPMKEPLIVEGKTIIIGLDTGACFGNKLTCYSMTEDKFYSVNTLKEDLDERSIREL